MHTNTIIHRVLFQQKQVEKSTLYCVHEKDAFYFLVYIYNYIPNYL